VKTYSVVFTPEAEEQLVNLYRYIEENASVRSQSESRPAASPPRCGNS